jgi:hypothetical protein
LAASHRMAGDRPRPLLRLWPPPLGPAQRFGASLTRRAIPEPAMIGKSGLESNRWTRLAQGSQEADWRNVIRRSRGRKRVTLGKTSPVLPSSSTSQWLHAPTEKNWKLSGNDSVNRRTRSPSLNDEANRETSMQVQKVSH